MTQQADWIKEREAIRIRVEAATPGPYTVSENHFIIADHPGTAFHIVAEIDCISGRLEDETMLTHSWADLRTLLSHADQDAAEMERLKIAAKRGPNDYIDCVYCGAVIYVFSGLAEDADKADEASIAHDLNCVKHPQTAELALRDQQISELEADGLRLDWLESIMHPRANYQEVYFAGLRNGDVDASAFQCELQQLGSYSGRDVRQAIDAARSALEAARQREDEGK